MKQIRNIIVICLFALLTLNHITAQEKKMIIIDPGHGGWDFGAVGYNGIKEKNIVLNISKEIDRLNTELFKNKFDIYLTRYKDNYVSLSNRTMLAKKLNADLFISIHCNELPNHYSTKGMEVYVINPKEKYSETFVKKSISLGVILTNEFSTKLNIRTKGVKFANFQVLREGIKNHPTILIETAYVSNKIEADYFKEHKNITAIALAILNSMDNYFEVENQ